MRNCGVTDLLIAWNPHSIFAKDFVYVDEIYSIAVATILVSVLFFWIYYINGIIFPRFIWDNFFRGASPCACNCALVFEGVNNVL